MEVFAQDAIGVVGAEYPIVEFGYDPAFRFRCRKRGASAATRTSRAPMLSRSPGSSKRFTSVARNSPVETSTYASPARVPLRETAAR